MRILAAVIPGALLAALHVAACVGDDPAVSPATSSSGGGEAEAGTGTSSGSSGAPTCAGDTVDACGATCTKCTAPAGGTAECTNGSCVANCAQPQLLCADKCVDTRTSSDSCGRCAHSCNGGGCDDSVCQPVEIAGGFTKIHGFDVSPMGVLMAVDDNQVKRCDVPTGCSAATLKTVYSAGGSFFLRGMVVGGPNVFFSAFTGDPYPLFMCPVTGCDASGPTVVQEAQGETNSSIGALAAGPSDLYWPRNQSYYGPYSSTCKLPQCAAVTGVRPKGATPYEDSVNPSVNPTREQQRPSQTVSVGAATALWDTGSLYNSNIKRLRSCAIAAPCPTPTEIDTNGYGIVALTYFDGKHYGISFAQNGTSIFSVSDVANTTLRTVLVADGAGASGLAVDASGIYWANGTSGKVLRCKKLTGCSSGEIETIAIGQADATRVRVDAGNVYWQRPTKILRVVKP